MLAMVLALSLLDARLVPPTTPAFAAEAPAAAVAPGATQAELPGLGSACLFEGTGALAAVASLVLAIVVADKALETADNPVKQVSIAALSAMVASGADFGLARLYGWPVRPKAALQAAGLGLLAGILVGGILSSTSKDNGSTAAIGVIAAFGLTTPAAMMYLTDRDQR